MILEAPTVEILLFVSENRYPIPSLVVLIIFRKRKRIQEDFESSVNSKAFPLNDHDKGGTERKTKTNHVILFYYTQSTVQKLK